MAECKNVLDVEEILSRSVKGAASVLTLSKFPFRVASDHLSSSFGAL